MIHSTQESPNPKKKLKILILGHVQSGKTSILSTYLNSSFKDEYNSTIGISYYSRIISFNKNPVKLNIVRIN
jgi:GTPase SAR1 family protein